MLVMDIGKVCGESACVVVYGLESHSIPLLTSTIGSKVPKGRYYPTRASCQAEESGMLSNSSMLKKELRTTTNRLPQTDLEDCANAFIDLARNTSMTGQKITVDAGLCPI